MQMSGTGKARDEVSRERRKREREREREEMFQAVHREMLSNVLGPEGRATVAQ